MTTHDEPSAVVNGGQAEANHDERTERHILIFIDDVRREAPKLVMTGAELKRLGEVPADYQLFLDVPGPGPDSGIRDDEEVHLRPGMHFHSVVAGTLGRGV